MVPPRLLPDEDERVDVFAQIRAGDLLVHHPYESFTASVERFIAQAADDPEVLTIKQTLYRTSGDSPIVQNLIRAAERGKQVVVLVEIKARFDEEANIVWARRLEQAGAHVVYGLVGPQDAFQGRAGRPPRGRRPSPLRPHRHRELQLEDRPLVRRPRAPVLPRGARRRRHRPVQLAHGPVAPAAFRRLIVAPTSLRSRFLELVEREASNARARYAGEDRDQDQRARRHGRDRGPVRASTAGVEIDCIIRGACCLVPGVEGVSERIRVRSVIGEFLEHSRIWMFANGGRPEWYIGSADLMERNLDRRVEVVTPVEDGEAQARLLRIIDVMLADNRRSWQLGPDGRWRRTETIESAEGTIDTFAILKEDAAANVAAVSLSIGHGAAAGSMDPRA